jgi:hypothetical protein
MKRIACLLVTLLIGAACFGQTATKETAQNPGFPRVVARLNLLQRTKAIGPETLYTPTNSGVFRITTVMVCTIPNGSVTGVWKANVDWTNEVGPNSVAFDVVGTKSPGTGFIEWILNASAGTPISLSTSAFSDTSGSQYNAYIILEQLE